MATVTVQEKKICDFCGEEVDRFVTESELTASNNCFYVGREYFTKNVVVNISKDVPYSKTNDICVDCLKKAFDEIIDKLKGDTK